MRGLPDWGRPLTNGYAAWAEDAFRLTLPDALVIAQGAGGVPEFRLMAWRPEVPSSTWRGYGRLDMTMALQATAATPDGSVRAMPALRGWVRLGAEALALPEELRAPVALSCSGTGAVSLVLPLRLEGVGFIERALAEGVLPVLATADLEIAGVARCVTGRVVVETGRLREAVAAGLTLEALWQSLVAGPVALGVTLDSDDPAVAEAAADHIRAILCPGALVPGADGLMLVWADTGMVNGRAVLDLAQPVVASRVRRLVLDPFAMARDLASGSDGVSTLVTKTTSGLVQAGQHRITIDANLPQPLAGPLAIGARLVFPACPPARLHEVSEEVELPADGGSVLRSVRLAVGEPVDWVVTAVAYMPTANGRGVVLRSGQPRAGVGPRVVLGRQDFPLHIVQVAAGTALLALADVELSSVGPVAKTRLKQVTPFCALALEEPGGKLTTRLISHDGQVLALDPHPAEDWRIELTDVPGYGSRVMEIAVDFPDRMLLRVLDVRPEGEAVQTLAFTPAKPVREVRWFCRDPFRPGLCWRWHDGEAAFSAPVSGDRLTLDATQGAVA